MPPHPFRFGLQEVVIDNSRFIGNVGWRQNHQSFEAARVAFNGIEKLRKGTALVCMADPLGQPERVAELAKAGVSCFALELMPRITRAQSMDALSSMSTVAPVTMTFSLRVIAPPTTAPSMTDG